VKSSNYRRQFIRFPMHVAIRSVACTLALLVPQYSSASHPSGISIAAPANNALFRPEETVSVTVNVDPALNPASVLIMHTATLETAPFLADVTPPYQFTFVVPRDKIGLVQVKSFVRNADGSGIAGEEISLNIVPVEAPTKLQARLSSNLRFVDGVGTTATAAVFGIYNDDARRNVSGGSLGSTYQSSDTSVVTVDATGRVEARAIGRATITVTNAGLKAFIPVEVNGTEGQTLSPQDVSSSVTVTAGGFRYDPSSRLYVQELTIRNTSDRPIPYPMELVISDLPPGVDLEGAIRRTKVVTPLGSPRARVALADAPTALRTALAPGALATSTLQFSNRNGQPITYRVRLFQGARL